MRRCISLFLIPACLMGQMWPHSHAGTGIAEANAHSSRPHVHLAGGHHHHHRSHPHSHSYAHAHSHHGHDGHLHSDKGQDSAVLELERPLTDHDQDALYLADLDWDGRCRPLQLILDATALAGICFYDPVPIRQSPSLAGILDPPDPHGGLPIYLCLASLRI